MRILKQALCVCNSRNLIAPESQGCAGPAPARATLADPLCCFVEAGSNQVTFYCILTRVKT
jgi:hypothetical protein